jgi:hypothetical protein
MVHLSSIFTVGIDNSNILYKYLGLKNSIGSIMLAVQPMLHMFCVDDYSIFLFLLFVASESCQHAL